jgi:hypothetical protein
MWVAMLLGATEALELHIAGRINATGEVQLRPSDLQTAKVHADWLKHVAKESGLSLSRIAREIGVAKSTLTNKTKPGAPPQTLHGHTIEKIVALTGMAAPVVAPPVGNPLDDRRRGLRGMSADAAAFVAPKGSSLATAISNLAAGRNAIHPWIVRSNALAQPPFGFLPDDVALVDTSRIVPVLGEAYLVEAYGRAVLRTLERVPPFDLLVSHTDAASFHTKFVVGDERVIVLGTLLPHRLRGPD